MALTAVVLTLMVLYCGQDKDFNVFWDTSGALNDPTGDKHTMELEAIVAEEQNFKSTLVASWSSLGLEAVQISAVSVYGDIWWTTEFNATTAGPLLENWALGGANILNSTSNDITSFHDIVFNQSNYRFVVYPSYMLPLPYAWFAVTVSPLSYSGLPLAFIAKQPSTPFRLPYVDGYLGCYPNEQITNLTSTKLDSLASYETCAPECSSAEFNVVIIKWRNACHCGILSDNPSGEDSLYCFWDCPGNTSQKCGGTNSDWQSVYHLPGPENMPGAYESGAVYTGSYSNNITIDIDIVDLQSTTGDPAFISNIGVTAAPASTTYRILYSADPCSGNTYTLQQITTKRDNLTNFAANGSNVDVDMIMVRCLRIVMSDLASSIDVKLIGPINTELISVPILAIQGVTTSNVTSTTNIPQSPPPPQPGPPPPPPPPSTTTTITTTTTTTALTTTTTSTSTPQGTTTSTSTTTTPPSTTTTPPNTTTSTSITTTTTPPTLSSTPTSTATSSTSTASTTHIPTTVTSTTPAPTTSLTSTAPATSQSTAVGVGTTTTDTQTTSSVQSTESSTTPIIPQPSCMCNCSDIVSVSYTSMTTAGLQAKIRAIQQHLAVNTTSLSSYIRAKTSASDNRPSAVSIGALGAGLLIALFGLILLIDSTILLKDLRMLIRNIKGLFSK